MFISFISQVNHRGISVTPSVMLGDWLKILVLFGGLMAACASPENALGQNWSVERSANQPVAICYHRGQLNRHLTERFRQKHGIGSRVLTRDETSRILNARLAVVRRVLEWAEIAYQKEVGDLGFAKPSGIWREHDGKQYLHLFLYDFGDANANTHGTVSRTNSKLSLNIRSFFRQSWHPDGNMRQILKGTVAHELFHAIQNSYSVTFSRWAKESTAEWCAEQVFPDQDHFLGIQARYLAYPQNSLHQVYELSHSSSSGHDNTSGHSHGGYALDIGRPYGASAFWMFLEKHYRSSGDHWMKQLWDKSRTETDAYAALAHVLGDGQKFGDQFRKYFAQFAVGALLHQDGPQEYQWHDVSLLVRQQGGQTVRLRPPYTKLKQIWNRYADASFTGPETAVLTLNWTADQPPLTEQAGPQFRIKEEFGVIAGAGFRTFRVPTTALGNHDLPLAMEMTAAETELEIRAIVKRGDRWEVVASNFDRSARRHQVVVPEIVDSSSNYVYFVVCRFGEDQETKAYPVRFSLVQPPVLRLARLSQSENQLFEARWNDQTSADGQLTGRTHDQSSLTLPSKTDTTPVELVVEFDREVRKGAEPACRLNNSEIPLQAAESNRIWRCQIDPRLLLEAPSRQSLQIAVELKIGSESIHVSLDEKPETIASLDMVSGAWSDYERDRGVFVIDMRARKSYSASMQTNTMLQQTRRGPVSVAFTLDSDEIGGLDQPYMVEVTLGPHRQFLYPTNVESYGMVGMHPLTRLNSFKLPGRLAEALPDEIKAVFVTVDGTRIEKTFPLEFEPASTSHFGTALETLAEEQKKWRARYEKSMASDESSERKFSVLSRDGLQLITYADDFDTAQAIWRQMMAAYQGARAEGADRNWLDRKYSDVEMAVMGIAYRFGRVDELRDLLMQRNDRGAAHLTDFIGVIDAVIRFENDTMTAHQLWKQQQSLPAAQRTRRDRPAMTEDWMFAFDSLADYTQPLQLPKNPITP